LQIAFVFFVETGSTCVEAPWAPRATSCYRPRPDEHATRTPSTPSLAPAHPYSLPRPLSSFPEARRNPIHGRCSAPLFLAALSPSEHAISSAVPPSSSPREESTRGDRRSRRRRRFSPQEPRSAASNSSPPALLWPSRLPRRPQGESPVRVALSPPSFRPESPPESRPAPCRHGHGMPWPLASVACPRGLGPQRSVARGQTNPGAKSPARLFYFQKMSEPLQML
jgi:hypothetical protein